MLFIVLVLEAAFSSYLPSGLALAYVVHEVVAVLGLNETGFAFSAVCAVDPVLELGNHLALENVLVESAVLAVRVSGVFLCELAELFSGLVALVVLFEYLFSFLLCSFVCLFKNGALERGIDVKEDVSYALGIVLVDINALFDDIYGVGKVAVGRLDFLNVGIVSYTVGAVCPLVVCLRVCCFCLGGVVKNSGRSVLLNERFLFCSDIFLGVTGGCCGGRSARGRGCFLLCLLELVDSGPSGDATLC